MRDIFACFRCWGSRSSKDSSEEDRLIAPGRTRSESTISQATYGTMSMTTGMPASQNTSRVLPNAISPPRATHEQRAKMAEISRAAGSHMRPIGTYILGHGRGTTSPLLRSVSQTSSRESSPSPIRPLSSPPGGVIGGATVKPRTVSDASQDTDFTDMTASTNSNLTRSSSSSRTSTEHVVMDANGVVRKSIFGEAGFASGRRTSSGSRPASGRRKRVR